MAWVQARAIELYWISSRIQNSMILNIPYQSVQQMAKVKTLVDSRAIENLVDHDTTKRLNMTLQTLPLTRNITNVDGTGNMDGPISQFCELRIHQGTKEDIQKFYVTNLESNQAILGYPWLKEFSPKINWATGKIGDQPILEAKWYQVAKRHQENIIIQCAQLEPEWEEGDKIILVAKTNMVQQWVEKVLKDRKEPEIPPQYR